MLLTAHKEGPQAVHDGQHNRQTYRQTESFSHSAQAAALQMDCRDGSAQDKITLSSHARLCFNPHPAWRAGRHVGRQNHVVMALGALPWQHTVDPTVCDEATARGALRIRTDSLGQIGQEHESAASASCTPVSHTIWLCRSHRGKAPPSPTDRSPSTWCVDITSPVIVFPNRTKATIMPAKATIAHSSSTPKCDSAQRGLRPCTAQ